MEQFCFYIKAIHCTIPFIDLILIKLINKMTFLERPRASERNNCNVIIFVEEADEENESISHLYLVIRNLLFLLCIIFFPCCNKRKTHNYSSSSFHLVTDLFCSAKGKSICGITLLYFFFFFCFWLPTNNNNRCTV